MVGSCAADAEGSASPPAATSSARKTALRFTGRTLGQVGEV